jgi:lipoprotein-anchoring transpeptidase ErfK/SrfK
MARSDLGPDHTEVDLDRQVLTVWRGGQLALVSHVSTGAAEPYCLGGHCGDAVTPEGDFRYEYRIDGVRSAPLGDMDHPVYFDHEGHAVHGDPEVPNRPASHGCVRIPLHISAYFQSLVRDGDPITLFRDA